MKKILILLLFILLFYSGCISSRFHTQLHICETAQCIQKNFGPPNYIENNGDFGKIWIYTNNNKDDILMKIYIDNNNNVYKRSHTSNRYHYGFSALSWSAGAIIFLVILITITTI